MPGTLPVVAVAAAGGWTSMLDALRGIEPALLQPGGGRGFGPEAIAGVLGFLGIGIAFLGSPQV